MALCFVALILIISLVKANIGEHSQIHLQNTEVPRTSINVLFYMPQVNVKSIFTYGIYLMPNCCHAILHCTLS